MFCPNCGREIPDGSKFCPYCGAKIEEGFAKNKSPIKVSKIIIPVILIVVLLFSVFAFVKFIKPNQPIWPMFRYNRQHTGQCPYSTENNNGTLKWKYQTGYWIRSSSAIGSDGTVYIGSLDGYLYALNPDGTLKWKYETGSVLSSPAIGSDGTIYVGSSDDYLYALNPDGTLKWKYQTGDSVFSSPAIGSDGTIYVGSCDHYLYAIGGKIIANLKGTLSVTSIPKGAKVYVNGWYKGTTPIDITLTSGNYSVKITKEGYKDYTKSIIIQERETKNVSITLTKSVPASVIMEEFNGNTIGNSYGITYTNTINGQGAVFSRARESRIEYPFSMGFPHEGTIEYLIKVYSGYNYSDYVLNDNSNCACIFTTGPQDVAYPGAMWVTVCNDGTITLSTYTTYGQPEHHNLVAKGTDFAFNEWHTIGISFGSQGQYIMLDGNIVASNTSYTESLQTCGNFISAVDVPTVGELVSCFWANNRYDKGFEGVIDRFRISKKQKDWYLSKTSPSQ